MPENSNFIDALCQYAREGQRLEVRLPHDCRYHGRIQHAGIDYMVFEVDQLWETPWLDPGPVAIRYDRIETVVLAADAEPLELSVKPAMPDAPSFRDLLDRYRAQHVSIAIQVRGPGAYFGPLEHVGSDYVIQDGHQVIPYRHILTVSQAPPGKFLSRWIDWPS